MIKPIRKPGPNPPDDFMALFAEDEAQTITRGAAALASAHCAEYSRRETEEGLRNEEAARMEEYDAMLFEGLFLRYGRAWVLAQMTGLLQRFPTYRKD